MALKSRHIIFKKRAAPFRLSSGQIQSVLFSVKKLSHLGRRSNSNLRCDRLSSGKKIRRRRDIKRSAGLQLTAREHLFISRESSEKIEIGEASFARRP